MARKEHIAYVPYRRLVAAFHENGGWSCAACGGRIRFLGFGHDPQPRVPLFQCSLCGRRSDGCQTFEGHHLLYGYCPLRDDAHSRCGYWLGDWAKARGPCPVCDEVVPAQPQMLAARG